MGDNTRMAYALIEPTIRLASSGLVENGKRLPRQMEWLNAGGADWIILRLLSVVVSKALIETDIRRAVSALKPAQPVPSGPGLV